MIRTIYSHGILNLNRALNHFIGDVNRCLQVHRSRYGEMNSQVNNHVKCLSAFTIQNNVVYFVTDSSQEETIVLLPSECGEYQERMNLL